jgi:hypothetical protein
MDYSRVSVTWVHSHIFKLKGVATNVTSAMRGLTADQEQRLLGIENETDCEECRLLGYISPVRNSQETHYVSATESSQLMLCKI